MHFPGGVQPSTWQLSSLCQAQNSKEWTLLPCLETWPHREEGALLSFLARPCLAQHASLYLCPKPPPICCFPCLFLLGQVTSDLAQCWSRVLCRLEGWGCRTGTLHLALESLGEKGSHQVIWGYPRSQPHQFQPSNLPEASAWSSGRKWWLGEGRLQVLRLFLLSGIRGAIPIDSLWFSNLSVNF